MKKNIYKWHRTLSIIIAFPVLLWAASGFMHPIMTNIRPKVATQKLMPVGVDSSRIHLSLQAALLQNHLDRFSNFRLVHIDTNWFYQVQPTGKKTPVYLSAANGKALAAGDWLYAQYLARQFLEGQEFATPAVPVIPTGRATPPTIKILPVAYTASLVHDCCGAATDCVLNPAKGAKVSNASLLTAFDAEYKSINRLLPVYRVNFDRPDGIRVFVETTQDRFAFAMDNKRFVFDRIFTLIHTWGWLDFLGKGKLAIEFTLAFLALCTTLMGIFIFFSTKTKKINGNELVKARRNHRYTSITVALFTLMFTFSGAFHALSKFKEDTRDHFFVDHPFASSSVNFNFSQLQGLVKAPVSNISLVSMYGHSYWRIDTLPALPPFSTIYIRTDSPCVLPQGEAKYAGFLATRFSGHAPGDILSRLAVTRLTNEYNFTDKRLPVWKISYAANDNERYYVETSTGRLSKRVNDKSLVEDYSFAFFHKHEFMAWGGKRLKDFSTMFWAMAQIVMVLVGLTLYVKYRIRNDRKRVASRG